MKLRHLTLALLIGVSPSAIAFAQTATNQIGKDAEQRPRDARAQPGLTSAPSDMGRIDIREGGTGTTPGGVNRDDLGGGNMIEEEALKSRSTVTRDAIDKIQPTANPYQMIEKLPGANVSSVDAFGLVGGNITVRGFNSDQIGMTIEGAPVNDSGNYALYPQEYVDAENMNQVSLAHGSPDLDSPHIGATGGVINIYMRDPSKVRGGLMSFSIGSDRTSREFMRVDTGQIGDFRGFISYSHYQGNHWNDPGRNNRNHVDFKGVWEPGQGNRIALSVIYNAAINNSYKTPTKAEYAAGTQWLSSLPSTFFTGSDQSAGSASNWYGFKVNPFKNAIVSMPSNFTIKNDLTFDTTPYYWYGFGNGGGTATLTERASGSSSAGIYFGNTNITGVDWSGDGTVTDGKKVLYYNPSITETNRPGIINKLTYTVENHKLIAGYWFEFANHKQTAPYAALNSDGSIADPYLTSGAYQIGTGAYTGSTLQRRDQLTQTKTNMLFAGDTWSINNRLTVEYGLKQVFLNRHVENGLPGAVPTVDYNDRATLPQVGVKFKIDEENQVYASAGTSFRSTPNYTLADSFSNSNGVKTPWQAAPTEKSLTGEVGHRFQGKWFSTAVALFATSYKNRQITTNVPDPTNPSSFTSLTINAGDAKMYGIDAEIGTRRFYDAWRGYVSGELLQTRIGSDLATKNSANAVDYLPTSGKQLPRAPRYQFALGIDYDDNHIFGNIAYKHLGSQYSTLMNDQRIADFGRVDAALGYRFSDMGFAKQPELKINFYNLLNKKVLVGVNGVQSNALATTGVNGGTIAAASSSPTYYLGEGFAALATFKVGF